MNRIDKLFVQKKGSVFSIYITAGYPELEDTAEIIRALDNSGVDMIEVGMPFSDPLADGPVIQRSSQDALENGITMKLLFEQVKDARKDVDLPLVFMGYLNPVMQFGFESFIEHCVEAGIDGLIIPDLPLKIYEQEYQQILEKSGIKFIMLITPQTSDERITQIAKSSGGFLYMVSSASTTGAKRQINLEQEEYFERINSMKIELPRLIGFGISNADTFNRACSFANGAIIGSAFIQILSDQNGKSIEEKCSEFCHSILHSE